MAAERQARRVLVATLARAQGRETQADRANGASAGRGMTAKAPRYSARCKHCGHVIGTGARIGDAELACLRDHVREAHACEGLPADAGVAETLKHVTVEREP